MVENLARGHIDMKAEINETTKNVRHLLYIINKLCDEEDDCTEDVFNDALSKYVPCENFAELQKLDGKLANDDFLSHAVSQTLINI